MPNITITNKKTFGRKLKKVVLTTIAAAVIGTGIYFHKDVEKKGEEIIAKWQIENVINDNDYVGARKKLDELKDKFTTEQTSELEKKIQSIHPDSLLAKIDQNKLEDNEDEFERKKELLKKITDGYTFLGKKAPQTDYKYLQTLLTYASSKLRESYSGRNEEEVVKTLKDIKNDGVLERIPHDGTAIINQNDFFYFRESVKQYIKSFRGQSFHHEEMNTAVNLGIYITEKIDSTRKSEEIKNLIDAYAEVTKQRIYYDTQISSKDKVKPLWILRKLENRYNYSNRFMDAEKEIEKFIWEM
ncbi:MAG: hypothetical protein KJ583_00760 [Nanoarchaeota archaeon]|nr:hypothetical protein [Nanoarchaeota archaeon]MBU1269616.1 hypothetical protein [Nanoarchaeota archaeon]MBU1603820.1 hypothetical protein [Nanoarchaeota archaeon]MBU2443252.1 hypothetical protein [Nanoarchaeota archaeon]